MDKLEYPETATVDQVDDYHGTPVPDPYRWLEDADSPATQALVEAQNAVTFAYLESIPEREMYRHRLTEIWNYERHGAPFVKGGRTFFFKNDGLQNQAVLYVQDDPAGESHVLLDPNTLSEDGTVALGELSISRDGRWLAWSASESGSDWRTWRIRDVATGEDLDDHVQWSKFSGAAWDHAGEGFYYSRYDAPAEGEAFEGSNYFQKLYYHRRGTDQDADTLVYQRPDRKEWGFQGQVSEDGRFLIISVWQGTSRHNRLYYQDLSRPGCPVVPLLDDYDASYTFLHNIGGLFHFQTDLEAPNGRIIAIDIAKPKRPAWRSVVPEGEDPMAGVAVLNNSFVVTYLHDVVDVVRTFDFEGRPTGGIDLPGLGSVSGFAGDSDATETYFTFNSYLNPGEIHHFDFSTGRSTLFRKPEINFDFSGYETERRFYESPDGTRVPLFLVHRRGLSLDGTNPTLLYGYGGFNISLNPLFRASILPFLEQGGVYAVANIRGGSEYGERWHQEGMLHNKQNVFDDFIAAAEYLIDEGYTSARKLAVHGGSNGGLLVGAVLNQRPELFAAAVPSVGVMDMLRFQHFTIGWAWVSDYGSPDKAEDFQVLRAYSPYHNITKGVSYPAFLVTGSENDARVDPLHARKMCAALQDANRGGGPIMLLINKASGHGGGTTITTQIEQQAEQRAFLMDQLGMPVPE